MSLFSDGSGVGVGNGGGVFGRGVGVGNGGCVFEIINMIGMGW